MICQISYARRHEFAAEIEEMHRVRYRVFKERLDWQVSVQGELELDHYDEAGPEYLMFMGSAGQVAGCVRLLPSQGPNMLRDTFPILLDGKPCPSDARIWESSRFCLDNHAGTETAAGLQRGTYELFLGMIEFGLNMGLTHIATVTDARMERILARAGWPLERLGQPRKIGSTTAVAGLLETSLDALQRVRQRVGIHRPVLWYPAPLTPVVGLTDAA